MLKPSFFSTRGQTLLKLFAKLVAEFDIVCGRIDVEYDGVKF
jgi:hypothetical protein